MGLLESLGLKNSNIDEELNESVTLDAVGLTGRTNVGLPEGNFIGDSFYDTGGVFGRLYNNNGTREIEKSYIIQQRTMSILPEVAIGIEEIMRELFDKLDPFSLTISGENLDTKKIYEEFSKFKSNPFTVIGNLKTPKNLLIFNLLKQAYVDGALCVYACKVPIAPTTEKQEPQDLSTFIGPTIIGNNQKSIYRGTHMPGVLGAKRGQWYSKDQSLVHGFMLESQTNQTQQVPKSDYFDLESMKASDVDHLLESLYLRETTKTDECSSLNELTKEAKPKENERLIFMPLDPTRLSVINDVVHYDLIKGTQIPLNVNYLIQADFGLFDTIGARYGYLQYAFKYANQLQTLQDMLVPMRFRRSVARRIFNVDVGNLPSSRAAEYMADTQRKFKYKKSYDIKSGKIVTSDNDHIGIVEDYWFANRSGSKGTTVEMMDEAGNFSDSLEDISYFNKKLYQSMFIPLRRIFESDSEYDYTANSIEVDEMRFNSFLGRIRFVYDYVFTEMFKIHLNHYMGIKELDNIKVNLNYDNYFEKNKQTEKLDNALNLFDTAKPYIGKLFSAETLLNKVFDMDAEEVQNEVNKIKAELEEDSIYYPFLTAMFNSEDDY